MWYDETCRVEVNENLSFTVRVSVNRDGETDGTYMIGTIQYDDHTYGRHNAPQDILDMVKHKMDTISDEELSQCISQS